MQWVRQRKSVSIDNIAIVGKNDIRKIVLVFNLRWMKRTDLKKWWAIRIAKAWKWGDTTQVEKNDTSNWKVYQPEVWFGLLIDVYENNTYAKRCIDLIANNVVAWWFNIVADTGENSDKLDQDITMVYNMFLNLSDENFLSMIRDRVVDYECTGNCALEVSRWVDWKPAGLYRIPINTIRYARPQQWDQWKKWDKFLLNPYSKQSEQVYYNKYQPDEKKRNEANGFYLEDGQVKTNEVIWMRSANPNDRLYGLASSVTLTKNYLINKYVDEFNANEFEAGMLSKFAIFVKNGALTQESVDALTEAIQDATKAKKWQTIPILSVRWQDADAKVEKLGNDIKDGSFIDLKKDARQDVLAAYWVPPTMLWFVDDINRSTSDTQDKSFYEKEIKPLQEKIEWIFTQMIKVDFWYPSLNFKFIAPDFDDKQIISNITNDWLKTGKYSINEARQMEGLDMIDDDWANERFVQTSMWLINVKDLANLSSENLESAQWAAEGEAIVEQLLSIRQKYANKIKKMEIKRWTDGEWEDEYLMNT